MKLELATTPEQLAKGLQFRESMPDDHAMLLCFDKPQKVSIHMHNVKFPLDLLFMNKHCMPLKSVRNAQPETEGYTCDNVKYVLETKAARNDTVKCLKCSKTFHYSKAPEVCMGGVKCPHCGTVINQNGEYHKTAAKIKYKRGDEITVVNYPGFSGVGGEITNVFENEAGHTDFVFADLDNGEKAVRLLAKQIRLYNSHKTAQRGMPEDVQHAKLKGWEQTEIMDPKKRDWIDDEAELGVFGMNEKQLKNLLGQKPTDDESEDIDPADLGVDLSLAGVRLDSTQKYLPADQKLYRENYWKEKRMTHIIDQVLKEAKIEKIEYKEWNNEYRYSITVYDKSGDKEPLAWLNKAGIKLFKRKFPKAVISIFESNDGHYLDEVKGVF